MVQWIERLLLKWQTKVWFQLGQTKDLIKIAIHNFPAWRSAIKCEASNESDKQVAARLEDR